MLHVVVSASAAARLARAARFVNARPPATEILIVGATRGAADDFARAAASRHGATFGLTRFSLIELAARAAAVRLAGTHRVAASETGSEAVAARAVFDAMAAGDLTYFEPVATTPGFPKALARTLHELRLAGLSADSLAAGGPAAADVGRLLGRVEAQLGSASADDRAALLRAAAAAVDAGELRWAGLPLVLLDPTVDSRAELEFLRALIARAPAGVATLPAGDDRARDALTGLGGEAEDVDEASGRDGNLPDSDLAHLRRHVFSASPPPVRERSGDVTLFSAPGEGREAVEIVRRILDEAAAHAIRFDEMAIALRAPQQYLGLLEHACARGGVPVYFNRGTRRPDPSGRAFVALLSCAVEGLSARRFDGPLSLGQVPSLVPHSPPAPTPPDDEALSSLTSGDGTDDAADESSPEPVPPPDSDDEAIVAGTLRSPWKWEELIVESAVVGGKTRTEGKARWRRRLDGLTEEYRLRLEELCREEPDDPRAAGLRRDMRNLAHLRAFALPIVDDLASWPASASWGEWLPRFAALAGRSLRQPARVQQVLADLRPMADIGPVTIDEARNVLHDRLATLERRPPGHRSGAVFVGTPHQIRGRTFRVVFMPGLAERIVPQRPREDPLLLDEVRARLGDGLVDQDRRSQAERLLLRIVIGAATERLFLSYPRMDVGETRVRVPSFYALDVVRAMTGQVPDHRVLAAEAAEEAGAMLAWPAPADARRAVDDLEHDLAVLKPLLDARDRAAVKGRAHYLLGLNKALHRSVVQRWSRSRPSWSAGDGLVKATPAIQSRRLGQRPYSLSALQRFSACPYQFLLASIHKLQPWEEPQPLVQLDPLTRGSLFHKIQAEFYRLLKEQQALPVTPATVKFAARLLDGVINRVAAEYAELLVPAIPRVWDDEIADLRRDLGIWLQKVAHEPEWTPEYFEFSFGLSDEGRDPRSVPDPVTVGGRFKLRGSVDLIERHAAFGYLRITDHKTGKNRSNADLIVGGGATLQPVLYGVAVEQALGHRVSEGRLFYCTTAGGYADHRIPLNDYARSQALQVLEIVDRALEHGFLPAAPAPGACRWCDFRIVCGPREEERVGRKHPGPLADLKAMRSMR